MTFMAKRWYIVHAYSNFEKKVAEAIRERSVSEGLEDQFDEILVPTEEVIEVRRGRKVASERKFFPGYVLVKMDMTDEAYHLIKDTPKVTGFLGSESKPIPILEKEAQSILHQVKEGVERPRSSIIYEVGEEVTVLAYGTMVYVAEAAAEETGVDAEIIDLRTILPLDLEAIEASVRKTGRCVIVHEATKTCGFGAELMAVVMEGCFYHLEAPVIRVTGYDTPYPHAHEWEYFPGPARVGAALKKVMEG